MPITDWFPNKIDSERSWYQNFTLVAPAIATELKIDAAAALEGATKWLGLDAAAETARTAYAGASIDHIARDFEVTVPMARYRWNKLGISRRLGHRRAARSPS